MPVFLHNAAEQGYRVVAADVAANSVALNEMEVGSAPTIIVLGELPPLPISADCGMRNADCVLRTAGVRASSHLIVSYFINCPAGSEGKGLRKLVKSAATHVVNIPGGNFGLYDEDAPSEDLVDSLNVSVSAGIFLSHFLGIMNQQPS
eukprot:scaffold1817_cov250-Pinguiococcus_pyrenoidosus.AAC.15